MSDFYHERTKHSRQSVASESEGLDWARRPTVFKEYPGARAVPLPDPPKKLGRSTGGLFESLRGEAPPFDGGSASLDDLSTILHLTNGVTGEIRSPDDSYYLRAAPSAGALYPTVTYVVAHRVDGLPAGLYHYGVRNHELRPVRKGREVIAELAAMVPRADRITGAAATLLFTTLLFRSSWKYGERAYRYCCLDAGHLAAQAAAAARALELHPVTIGRFDDAGVNALLELERGAEEALLLMPLGRSSEPEGGPAGPPPPVRLFEPDPIDLEGETDELIRFVHGEACLRVTAEAAAPGPSAEPPPPRHEGAERVELAREFDEGDDFAAVVARRRSNRKWRRKGMTAEALSSLLHSCFGMARGRPDPSVEANHALHIYVAVHNVKGIEPGVYWYDRAARALALLDAGDFRERVYEAALFQDAARRCAVVPIMTIDCDRYAQGDGERGYRYAAMDAGMLGGRLYLAAESLGLGCCGIGAYFDDEVSALIGAHPAEEMVIYLAAVGLKVGESGARR